ncbi:MAG: M48 family metallopeptidase [Gemmatimonadota bacterium]
MIRRLGAVTFAAALAVSVACAVSLQEETDLGRRYSQQINAEIPLIEDPEIKAYFERLGTRIAQNADPRKLEYHFFVVNSDVVNAFALPGGYVYLNRGLIERAHELSEVAGVLGHEIGHVVARHGVDQMQKAQAANVGLGITYILLGRQPTDVEAAAINVGGGLVFMKFSRDDEREADHLAVDFLIESGIDPHGIPAMFKILLEERRRRPGLLEQWFSSHPLTEDRIAEVQEIIARVPEARLQGLTRDTEDFRRIQARLEGLPPAPKEPSR